ncbi:MAG: hypothetical protein ABR564_03450 [Candidatus Dormibacteria bacterium]
MMDVIVSSHSEEVPVADHQVGEIQMPEEPDDHTRPAPDSMPVPPTGIDDGERHMAANGRPWVWIAAIIVVLVAAIALHLTGVLGGHLHS